jgi:chromosomal replication initiation ATPase DnaA
MKPKQELTPIQAIDKYLDKICPIDKDAILTKRNLRRDYIVRVVCNHYGHTFQEINIMSRTQSIVIVRQTINYLLRERIPSLTLSKIGEMWTYGYYHTKGQVKFHQDHSNVINSINKFSDLLYSDKRVKAVYNEINAIIDRDVEQGLISFK